MTDPDASAVSSAVDTLVELLDPTYSPEVRVQAAAALLDAYITSREGMR